MENEPLWLNKLLSIYDSHHHKKMNIIDELICDFIMGILLIFIFFGVLTTTIVIPMEIIDEYGKDHKKEDILKNKYITKI